MYYIYLPILVDAIRHIKGSKGGREIIPRVDELIPNWLSIQETPKRFLYFYLYFEKFTVYSLILSTVFPGNQLNFNLWFLSPLFLVNAWKYLKKQVSSKKKEKKKPS